MSSLSNFTLATIDEGDLEEKFQQALHEIIGNIHDPKTAPDDKREIVIKLEFKPDRDDRGLCSLVTSCIAKPAKEKVTPSLVYSGIDGLTGEIGVKQKVLKQPGLFDELPVESSGKKVVSMRKSG